MDKKIEDKMPMDKKGLYVMLAGLGLMVLGYILMSGGGVTDPRCSITICSVSDESCWHRSFS